VPVPTRVTTNGTSTASSAATATSLVVNYPSGSASGDLLILCVGTYRNATGTYTHTTPSGWTLLDNNNQSGASDAKNTGIFGCCHVACRGRRLPGRDRQRVDTGQHLHIGLRQHVQHRIHNPHSDYDHR